MCAGLAEAGLIASNLSGGDNRGNRAVFHPDRYFLIRNDDMLQWEENQFDCVLHLAAGG